MNDKYFCASPFVRVTLNPNGDVSTCCYYPKFKKSYETLSDIFYGDEMIELRQRMLNGEKLKGCQICYDHDSAGKKSIRQAMNSIHQEIDEINNPRLQELEFASSTKCNFKCITCNSNFSSAWEEEISSSLNLRKQYGFSEHINHQTSSNYFPNENDIKNLIGIIITGGEPTLEKKFDKAFFEMLEKNVDMNNFVLSLVTNNSKFINSHWKNFVKKLRRARVNISLDGVKDVGEFVRFGMKWKIFCNNLEKWKNVFKDKESVNIDDEGVYKSGLSFNFVTTCFNLLNLPDTIKFLQSHNLLDVLVLHNCFIPEYLNPQYLPDSTKNLILENLKNYNVDLMGCGSAKSTDFVENILYGDNFNSEHCKKMINYANYLEKIFGKIPDQSLRVLNDIKTHV